MLHSLEMQALNHRPSQHCITDVQKSQAHCCGKPQNLMSNNSSLYNLTCYKMLHRALDFVSSFRMKWKIKMRFGINGE